MYMYKLSIHEDQHSSGNEDEDIYDDGLLVSSTFYRYICLFLSLSFLRFRVKFLGFYFFLVFFVLFRFVFIFIEKVKRQILHYNEIVDNNFNTDYILFSESRSPAW